MTTTVYYAGDGPEPEPVECETPGYPNKDAKGLTMYNNSHYPTLAQAWDRMCSEAAAGLRLSTSSLEQAKRVVQHATEEVAADALRKLLVDRGREAFLRGQKP